MSRWLEPLLDSVKDCDSAHLTGACRRGRRDTVQERLADCETSNGCDGKVVANPPGCSWSAYHRPGEAISHSFLGGNVRRNSLCGTIKIVATLPCGAGPQCLYENEASVVRRLSGAVYVPVTRLVAGVINKASRAGSATTADFLSDAARVCELPVWCAVSSFSLLN